MEAQINLENHQLSLEEFPTDLTNLEKEATLHQSLHVAYRLEEENLRQKFRCLWLKAGDQNTSFFHKHAEGRKNFKAVKEFQVHGQTTKDFEEIKRAAHDHFQQVYSKEVPFMGSPILDTVPSRIHQSKNRKLTAPISNKEIKKALASMEPDKAPSPDGFTARFLKSYWKIVKKDMVRMVRKSQNCNKIGGSTNSAFLALIPK